MTMYPPSWPKKLLDTASHYNDQCISSLRTIPFTSAAFQMIHQSLGGICLLGHQTPGALLLRSHTLPKRWLDESGQEGLWVKKFIVAVRGSCGRNLPAYD
jgi:hypothetical protein